MKLSKSHRRILEALAEGEMSRDTLMSCLGGYVSSNKMRQLEAAALITKVDPGADGVKGGTRWQVSAQGRETIAKWPDPA